ncbi:MAG TPA: YceI family protein [Novosphingobium sp.]|nr:YceI family protein [Novosphingobium sp.]
MPIRFRTALPALLITALLPAAAAQASPAPWYHDPAGCFLELSYVHAGMYRIPVIFPGVSAQARIDPANLPASSFDITVQTASLQVYEPLVHQQMTGNIGLLEPARYPQMRLVSRRIVKTARGYDVWMDTTIHGISHPVRFAMVASPDVPFEGTHFRSFTLRGAISRKAFGMGWMQPEPLKWPLFGDRFDLDLTVELTDRPFGPPPAKPEPHA